MYTNATPQHSSYTAATSPDDNLVLGLHAWREFGPRHPWMQPGHDSIIVIAEVVLVGRPPNSGSKSLPQSSLDATPSSTRRHLAYETASCAHARHPSTSTYEHASTKPPKPRFTRPRVSPTAATHRFAAAAALSLPEPLVAGMAARRCARSDASTNRPPWSLTPRSLSSLCVSTGRQPLPGAGTGRRSSCSLSSEMSPTATNRPKRQHDSASLSKLTTPSSSSQPRTR
jgi:hypothetical protein